VLSGCSCAVASRTWCDCLSKCSSTSLTPSSTQISLWSHMSAPSPTTTSTGLSLCLSVYLTVPVCLSFVYLSDCLSKCIGTSLTHSSTQISLWSHMSAPSPTMMSTGLSPSVCIFPSLSDVVREDCTSPRGLFSTPKTL